MHQAIGYLHDGSLHLDDTFPLRAVENLVHALVRMEFYLVPRRENCSSEPRQVWYLAIQDHHLEGERGADVVCA